MRRVAGHSGFTLLEVVLAIGLIVGLVGAVYAFYDQIVDIRYSILRNIEIANAQRGVMTRITNELRGGIVHPFLGRALTGTEENVKFMTTTIPGPATWVRRDKTDEQIPPEHDMVWVEYRLRIVEDEDGNLVNEGLERVYEKILASQVSEEDQKFTSDLIAPSIKFIYFEYFNGRQWAPQWARGADLPLAVNIYLGAEEMPEGMEYIDYLESYETVHRVVYVPGSTLALSTAAAQMQR